MGVVAGECGGGLEPVAAEGVFRGEQFERSGVEGPEVSGRLEGTGD